jgi:hypothetical protein
MPPGDNLGLGVLEVPLAFPAAVALGLTELVEAVGIVLVCIGEEPFVEDVKLEAVGLAVESVENILRLC